MVTVVEIGRPGIQDPGLEARKAWVPVSVQAVTPEIAEKLAIPGKKGVRVTRVFGAGAAPVCRSATSSPPSTATRSRLRSPRKRTCSRR